MGEQSSLGVMVGGGRLVWVPIVLPLSSAWYGGDGERRYYENRASLSGVRALPVLESSFSRRDLGELISYGQMPSSEGVSVSGEEVEWSGHTAPVIDHYRRTCP